MNNGILALAFLAAPCMATSLEDTLTVAEEGDAKAQEQLGVMYAQGQGVARDFGAAVRWWRKAAVQGNPQAQYDLGLMYALGRGVARDNRAAVRWCHKAAEQGLAKAQYYLGLQYGGGHSMARDEVAAYKWYSLAAAQGYEGARTLRDAVASAISTKQIAQAQ
jgi:hypothetical protein